MTAEVENSFPKLAIWSECVPYPRIEKLVPCINAHGITLFVAVREDELEAFGEMWGRLPPETALRPWLLLRREEGYWANKWNLCRIETLVKDLLQTLKGKPPQWITLDVEPPPCLTEKISTLVGQKDYCGAVRLLRKSSLSRRGKFLEAQQRYRQLVQWLHGHHINVHATTTPFVLHDAKGTYRMQSALGIPIGDVGWDELSFMVYRPEYTRMLKLAQRVSADLVYAYAQRAYAAYGEIAGVDLGEVGTVPPCGYSPEGQPKLCTYSSPRELDEDYRAAQAAKVQRMHVYSLDGLISQGVDPTNGAQLTDWFTPPSGEPPRWDSMVRGFLPLLDGLSYLLPVPKY